MAQPRQQQGEAVVGEIDVADGESGNRFEAVVELESPGADVGLAVVGLGEDVGDPESDEPTERKTLMVRMGLEVLVQEVGEPELSEEAEDQGDVIDPFVDEAECGRHGGAPTRYEENRRCTAGQWQREEPGGSHVNMHRLRGIDKEVISRKLYVCSAKEEVFSFQCSEIMN